MIAESDLQALCLPGTRPDMVTEVPGPKVVGAHGRIRQVRVLHPGRRRLSGDPRRGDGLYGEGRRRQSLYRHGGRSGRQRRGPRPSQGARGGAPAVRAHHAHHRHHQPQAYRAGQEGLGHHAGGPAWRLPHVVLPGRVRCRGDRHQVLAQATGRTQILAFQGAYHGVWCGTSALTTGYNYRHGWGPLIAGVQHLPTPTATVARST